MKKNFIRIYPILLLLLTFAQVNAQELAIVQAKSNEVLWTKNQPNVEMVAQIGSSKPMSILEARCWCIVSFDDLTNKKTKSGVCHDFGAIFTFKGVNPENSDNETRCNTMCTDAAKDLPKQALADCACASGKNSGTVIRAWSKVGDREYKSAHGFGTLVNQAEVSVTTCTCPTGWLANPSNQNGGVTTDGKCKKGICTWNEREFPSPPNGTPIGTWGFTWANGLYVWGSAANGGVAVCKTVITTPRLCKLQ